MRIAGSCGIRMSTIECPKKFFRKRCFHLQKRVQFDVLSQAHMSKSPQVSRLWLPVIRCKLLFFDHSGDSWGACLEAAFFVAACFVAVFFAAAFLVPGAFLAGAFFPAAALRGAFFFFLLPPIAARTASRSSAASNVSSSGLASRGRLALVSPSLT